MKKKYPFYFYIIAVSLPFIFIIVLEGGLRLFNYGQEIPQWVQYSDEYPNTLILNPYIASRYFQNLKTIPNPAVDGFDKIKKENSFRIFVLGGSSAAGFPYDPNAAFSKFIKAKLQIEYPNSKIEVINLAMSAINSYTIRDFAQGVIEQKPDLILIYAGHNEYYGALGVGSTESVGSFRMLVNFVIWSQQFKTVQLIRNLTTQLFSLVSSDDSKNASTLMEKIVREQQIPFQSDLYQAGLDQWKGNLDDILSRFSSAGVPVILGELVCNLKDQKPFSFIDSDTSHNAEKIFEQAKRKYEIGEFKTAKNLFSLAKDLDPVRFRAPNEINLITKEIAKKYNYVSVNLDSALSSYCSDGIIGNNLMTDHLHPNYNGQKLIAETFYKTMKVLRLVPKTNAVSLSESQITHAADSIKLYTELDSLIADFRIKTLKSRWPFVSKNMIQKQIIFTGRNLTDSLAFFVAENGSYWQQAHFVLAKSFLRNGNVKRFLDEMNVIIYEAPFSAKPYHETVNELIAANKFDLAIPYLEKQHKIKPDAFTNKCLGSIKLLRHKYEDALPFLVESNRLNPKDPLVTYNLSVTFYNLKKYQEALAKINECLKTAPSYPKGSELRQTILSALHSK